MADPVARLHTDAGAGLPLLGWASRHPLDPRHIITVDPRACLPGKPYGGLWTSPILGRRRPPTATAWTRWCRTEAPHRRPVALTILQASADARILVIDHDQDTAAVDSVYGRGDPQIPPRPARLAGLLRDRDWQELNTQRRIDWAAIATDFDAVHVSDTGLGCGGGTIPRLRWDVPTVWFTRAAFEIVDQVTLAARHRVTPPPDASDVGLAGSGIPRTATHHRLRGPAQGRGERSPPPGRAQRR
jgi:hypothetical protein